MNDADHSQLYTDSKQVRHNSRPGSNDCASNVVSAHESSTGKQSADSSARIPSQVTYPDGLPCRSNLGNLPAGWVPFRTPCWPMAHLTWPGFRCEVPSDVSGIVPGA